MLLRSKCTVSKYQYRIDFSGFNEYACTSFILRISLAFFDSIEKWYELLLSVLIELMTFEYVFKHKKLTDLS